MQAYLFLLFFFGNVPILQDEIEIPNLHFP